MKQTIYIFILTLGLLSFYGTTVKTTNAKSVDTIERTYDKQTDTYINNKFDNWLVELKDKDSLKRFKTELDSIRMGFNQTNNSKKLFSLSDKWNLIYFQFSGWEEHFFFEPMQRNNINHCSISKNQETTVTSKEIFEEFKIGGSLSLKQFPLNYFPLVLERDAPFNGKWTAIHNTEYLIIRLVQSYPDGNATSWYKERVYYFRNADK